MRSPGGLRALWPPDGGRREGVAAAVGGGWRRRGAVIWFSPASLRHPFSHPCHLFLQGTQAPLHELVPGDQESREAMGYQGREGATESLCRPWAAAQG
jgi:hypothetical protein